MKRLYIVYSQQNRAFAETITHQLRSADYKVWLDAIDHANPPDKQALAGRAFNTCDGLIVLLDSTSITSRHAKKCYHKAQRSGKKIIAILTTPLLVELRLPERDVIDATIDPDRAIQQVLVRLNSPILTTRYPYLLIAFIFGLLFAILLVGLNTSLPDQDHQFVLPTRIALEPNLDSVLRSEASLSLNSENTPELNVPDFDSVPPPNVNLSTSVAHDVSITSTSPLSGTSESYVTPANRLTETAPQSTACVTPICNMTPTSEGSVNNNGDDDDLPFASIYANPLYGTAPLTVVFENDTFGTAISYAWDFNGDGVIDSTAENPPPYTYSEAGTYTVRLSVMGVGNVEGYPEETQIIVYEVDDVVNTPTVTPTQTQEPDDDPFASFFANPMQGDAPLTVYFEDDTWGNAVSYAWDFNGDGIVDSTVQNPPAYTYYNEGTYDVSLTVVGASGISDTITSSIIVYAPEENLIPPEARFSVDVTRGSVPLTVTFTDESSGGANLYLWDFDGDGTVDHRTGNPPAHTYTTAGIYYARLVVSGAGGVSMPFSLPIVVEMPMTPTLTATSSPTLTPSFTYTASPTHTATATIQPEATDELENTLAPSATITPSITITANITETVTNTAIPSHTYTITPSPTASVTVTSLPPTDTPLPTATLTPTPTPTSTP